MGFGPEVRMKIQRLIILHFSLLALLLHKET